LNREDLEHIIRAAGDVTDEYEFIIVGSQSILGPIPYPPDVFKLSAEADIYPRAAEGKSELIEGALGEGSQFHTTYGYYAQGVDSTTAKLPLGWEGRLHRVQSEKGTKGVAVRRRPGCRLRADRVLATRAVLHHDGLIEPARELVADQARHRIRAGPGPGPAVSTKA
jgi:hypothetical protein